MYAVARASGIFSYSRVVSAVSKLRCTVTSVSPASLPCSILSTSLLSLSRNSFVPSRLPITTYHSTLIFSAVQHFPSSCASLKQHLARRIASTAPTMERNGDLRKRKTSPVNIIDRPTKHLRPDIYDASDGNLTPDGTLSNGMESDGEGSQMLPLTATAETAEWQATIEKVVRNVVSIHFCQTCSFDTDAATSSEATGFVVDAERGYILTNRHVVGPGPFWGYCIFDNHEEVGRGEVFPTG